MNIQNTKILEGHKSSIYKLVYEPNSGILYSVGGEGWIVEWNPFENGDGQLLAKVPDQIFSFFVSDHYFLVGTFQGNFYVIDKNTKDVVFKEKAHSSGIFSLFSTQQYIYSLGGDGKIIRWRLSDFVKDEIVHLTAKPIRCHDINKNTLDLAVGSSDGNVYIVDFHSLYVKRIIENAHDRSIFSLLYCDDKLLTGGMDAKLKIWSPQNQYTLEESIDAHWFTINDILLTNNWMFTASRDKSIRCWSRKDFSPITTIKWGELENAHMNSVNSLAWSSEHNTLISAGDDRTIRLWNILS